MTIAVDLDPGWSSVGIEAELTQQLSQGPASGSSRPELPAVRSWVLARRHTDDEHHNRAEDHFAQGRCRWDSRTARTATSASRSTRTRYRRASYVRQHRRARDSRDPAHPRNPDCHVILRGGRNVPNYPAEAVRDAVSKLWAASLPERVVVDASHDSSGKDHNRQPTVVGDIAAQIAGGNEALVRVMLESFIAGRQELDGDRARTYGQSITDACMSWETTVDTLDTLAAAVRNAATRTEAHCGVIVAA